MKTVVRALIGLAALIVVGAGAFMVGKSLRSLVERRRPTLLDMRQITDSRPLSGAARADSLQGGADVNPSETFRDVLLMMRSEYVDRIDDDTKLVSGAVRTMLYSLDDPATRYWNKEQYQRLKDDTQGVFTGIGARVAIQKQKIDNIDQRRVTVVAVAPGGPAAAAGLRAGDRITELDGNWVIAYDPRLDLNRLAVRTMPEVEYRKALRQATKKLTDGVSWPRALDKLMAPGDADMKLTVVRANEPKALSIVVKKAEFTRPALEVRSLPGGRVYVRITRFTADAPGKLAAALKDNPAPGGLILDLRDNPGGPDLPGEASAIRSMASTLGVLGVHGKIGIIGKGSSRRVVTAAKAAPKSSKLVVIVNQGTANVAEMAAGALRAQSDATLLGSTTCGDSVYQKLVPLKVGAMTVSAGTLMGADGKPLPARGLDPDIAAGSTVIGGQDDPMIARATALLGGRTGGRS